MSEVRASALPAVLLPVTPGPDALPVLRSSARGGRRAGPATGAALRRLRRPRVDRALQRLLGVELVGVSAAVALERS